MRNPIYLLIIVARLTPLSERAIEFHKAAVTYRIRDEGGQLVSKARLRVGFWRSSADLEQGRVQVTTILESDSAGKCVAEGRSDGHIPADVSKQGYYSSSPPELDLSQVRDNRWEPWNKTVEVLLKKIGN